MKKLNSLPVKFDKVGLHSNMVHLYLKLENISGNSKKLKDLFSPKAIFLRQKLKHYCDQLLSDDSLEYGKKAIEYLWRCCFYNFMQFYKNHKKFIKLDEYNLLVAQLTSGVGYFYSLLMQFSMFEGIKLSFIVPEFLQNDIFIEEYNENKKNLNLYTINDCTHRILICLGDIYRYLDSLGQSDCRVLAIKWYNAAILFEPKSGMPFNQLGSLSTNDNYNLNSIYYYMRCIACNKPFESAEENLKIIFNLSKNLIKDSNFQGSDNVFLVKKCLLEFINLFSLFWTETDSISQLEIAIGNTLNLFNQTIYLKPKSKSTVKPGYLCPENVFHLAMIIIMLNEKFKKNQNTKINYLNLNSIAIAFGLNFLFYLITVNIKQIKEKNVVDKFVISKENRPNKNLKENIKIPKRSLSRLRRKANLKFSDEESFCMVFDDEDDDLNELEETALSTIDALEMSSDMSENGSVNNEDEEDEENEDYEDEEDESTNSLITNSEDETNSLQNSGSNSSNQIPTVYEIERFLNHLYTESSLPTIKIIFDWLRINENLFEIYHKAFNSLFANLVELLNVLLDLEIKALKSNENLKKFKYDKADRQVFPLSIDVAVSGLDTFKSYQKKQLDYDKYLNYEMTNEECGFLCLQNIISFGFYVSGKVSKNKITFDDYLKKFVYNEMHELSEKKAEVNNLNTNDLLNNSKNNLSSDTSMNTFVNLKNGFDFGSPEFMKSNFSIIGDFTNHLNNHVIPNISHLWLDIDNNEKSDQNDLLKKNCHLNINNNEIDLNSNRIEEDGNKFFENLNNNFLPYILVDSTAFCEYLQLIKELVHSKQFMIVVPNYIFCEFYKKRSHHRYKEPYKWINNEHKKYSKYFRILKKKEKKKPCNLENLSDIQLLTMTELDFYNLLEHGTYLKKKYIEKFYGNNVKCEKVILLYGKNNCFPANYDNLLDLIGLRSQDISSFVKQWKNCVKGNT